MAAIPFMPLYVSDFLADTPHLSTAESGAYMLLIMTYWQRGGPLPADERKLGRIARATPDEWAELREDVLELFTLDEGVYRHKRIDAELAKAAEKIEQAKRAGKASAASRLQRNGNARSTPAQRTHQRNGNHTEEDTDTDKIKDIGSNEPSRRKRISYTPEFEDGLWKPYPNTAGMSKPEAFAAWEALTAEERQQATDRLPAFIKWMAGQGKDYRTLHACRYLSKKRFESLEPVAIAAVSGVPILLNTPQHRAWQQYHFERREISRDHAFKASRYGADMDMREETEWPPNTRMEAAE